MSDQAQRYGRRSFIRHSALWSAAGAASPLLAACGASPAPDTTPQQPVKLTIASKFGATERLQWAKETTAKPNFEWDFFVMPKHPRTGKRGGTVDDLPFVTTKDTKAPDAAWKLNLFVADKFAQDLVGKYGLQMPALKVSAADPQGWLAPPPASMRISLEQVKFASTLSYHKNWMLWYNEIANQMLPAFKGEKSIKDACDQASRIGDTLLRGM